MARLKRILPKNSGRSRGRVTTRHQGGRHKRYLRVIDYKRDKWDIWGVVESVEYDPNRGADVAMVVYEDGERRYIVAPTSIEKGKKIIASASAPIEAGNALPLGRIPVGTSVHNIEITPRKGGQMVRGAGSLATVHGREEDYVLVKLPSGEIRRFVPESMAVVGQVSNAARKSRRIGKAGLSRRMGRRPTVRGTAQHPGSHPHGGGEGRTGVGMKYPKTFAGRPAVGRTRRRRKHSDGLIIKRRKAGKHQRII